MHRHRTPHELLASPEAEGYNVDTMSTMRITWADAQLMPEDGKRYEAIDGELYVTAAPVTRHQRISGNLYFALRTLLEEPGYGSVLPAPIGVEFPETEEGVQPDLIFVAREREAIIVKEGIRGAPDLVVEIGSPSTASRDRTIKLKLYRRQGVPQYWIVDPETNTIDVWDFAAGATGPTRHSEGMPVRLGGRDYGELELSIIFPPEP
jgi:Uma2 family endonuclease